MPSERCSCGDRGAAKWGSVERPLGVVRLHSASLGAGALRQLPVFSSHRADERCGLGAPLSGPHRGICHGSCWGTLGERLGELFMLHFNSILSGGVPGWPHGPMFSSLVGGRVAWGTGRI